MNVKIYFDVSQRTIKEKPGTVAFNAVMVGRRIFMRGVLFDFDGTLTQPGAIDFKAIKQEIGCPRDVAILEHIKVQASEERIILTEILEGYEADAARLSIPNKGAEVCLSTLRTRHIPIGIITRNSLKSVVSALQQFDGIKVNDFDAVITREAALPKPSPEGVYKAAENMGCLPRELMVVGDFRFDIIAGWKAGAMTILLTNGGGLKMAPEDPKPDYVCGHLDEVVKIVLDRVTLP